MEEEVWNGLSLSSLYNHKSSATIDNSLGLQYFLDRPSSRKLPQQPTNDHLTGLWSSFCRDTPTPKDTVLSLSTESVKGKKRGSEGLVVDGPNDDDKRKRLMKNRESADRSRARKQAYTMELEKEVSALKKENAKLKNQLKMFSSEGYTQLPKKHNIHRTLTAPF